MPFDRFLIAPINTGLQTNLKSWQIMDDAFETLQNAYVFRGRVRKRFGSTLMATTQLGSRLRINLGNLGASPSTINLPATPAGINQLQIGQSFSIGTAIFTVYQLGAGVATLTTSGTITATIDNTVNPNTITFTGGVAGTPVFYYPSNPVMGITQYESGAVNNHPTYAFDTQFVYLFATNAWARSGTAVWHGTNLNYFWTTNWQGVAGSPVLFATNFNATVPTPGANDDPIWWTANGSTWTSGSGANAFYFLPNGGAVQTGPYIKTCRIIVPFKNRLVLLNTIENDNSGGAGVNTAYVNRCRYSFNGSPFAANAWYEPNQSDAGGNIAAGAGFIDAATEEAIISCEFIKDRLIVYFERSTWELAYTGNEILPFVWQKLNTELGSQSTFSTIPFDRDIYTIGNTGVHSCNGSNVKRIDDKIPDQIFTFETRNNQTQRTVGIRDYYTEVAIWTYVSSVEATTQSFPNRLLIYNYKNDSWAINDDCFTFFGYLEQVASTTWASSVPLRWYEANMAWNAGPLQANQRRILGGTPEGFVLIIEPDVSRNAPSMSITNMTFNASGVIDIVVYNHNLVDLDFILLENIEADAPVMTFLNGGIFQVNTVDANTIQIDTYGGLVAGTYKGAGTCARVSNIQIKSKRFNPYVTSDRNVYVAKIDFAVERTAAGQITVDYLTSSAATLPMIQQGEATGSILGSGILETSPYSATLYPMEQFQDLLWHPIYFQSSGQFIQLSMYLSDDQMINPNISLSDFVLEAMLLFTQPTSDRMQ